MFNGPLSAYESVNKKTMSGREVEASVLSKAASKLKSCRDHWDREDREVQLEDALKFNQRIWSIFQGELVKEDNPLPAQLKQDILRLSAFIDKRIFEIMAYPAREKLKIIIDINNNLAAGLRSVPEQG